MRFRTEIELRRSTHPLTHKDGIILMGSCFTDEIGAQLVEDGFDVLANPFGALYNPASIAACLDKACRKYLYTQTDLLPGPRGFHCLDYATRYSGNDMDALLADLNGTLDNLRTTLRKSKVVIITLGSAYVYSLRSNGIIVGNCHKFPANDFERSLLSVDAVQTYMQSIIASLRSLGIQHIIFTVSPIRHVADGLHGNTVSKSTLLLAIEKSLCEDIEYFPSYEIMQDDLRDYRFYAADMKHPSATAVEYIYECFSKVYFDESTRKMALENRKRFLASQHRPIL